MSNNAGKASGVLEIDGKGLGFLRQQKGDYPARPTDPVVARDLISRYRLRTGLVIEGPTASGKNKRRQAPQLGDVVTVNGHPVDDYLECASIDSLTVIDPTERIRLEHEGGPVSMRILDIVTPIGKGQRGLLVAPPRSGKTIILQQIAKALAVNHPEIWLLVLLIDERPEEATEMRRTVHGEVVASNADRSADDHVRMATLMIEVAKRRVEMGEDVVVLIDSLTRMGRAFNKFVGTSGRTMSGGIDIRALEGPKRLFGAARNIENGGSLTIVATVLVETNSRMDDIIFEEFKGTGNMELLLSRDLANYRIWPAVDIPRSGTRKEERFYDEETVNKIHRLRRELIDRKPRQAMEDLLARLGHHKDNAGVFAAMAR